MSNVFKYNSFQVNSSDKVIIDSNRKIMEKLGNLNSGVKKAVIGKNPLSDVDGFVSGIDASVVEELVSDPCEQVDLSAAKEEADAIIADANKNAETIILSAKAEAEKIKSEAQNAGYIDGTVKAEAEYGEKNRKLEEEYQNKMSALEADYQNKLGTLEPDLVDMLLKVFSKVTHAMADDKKDMIISLINSVMRNTELSRDFFIRVSPEDYKFALNNQDKIYSSVAKDVHIEISEDSSLERNQCIIETDAGVFDCSLDIQLENLIKDIKLLSCMNE